MASMIEGRITWDHLRWFAREFRHGFKLSADEAGQLCGGLSRDKLRWATTPEWTQQIKRVCEHLAKPLPHPFDVSGRPENWNAGFAVSSSLTQGEYLFDLCWHTYRAHDVHICDYHSSIKGNHVPQWGPPWIELALESEFSWTTKEENIRIVMDDFCKLRDVRALLKVMVFSYHSSVKDDLVHIMQAFADCHLIAQDPPDSYLLIGDERKQCVWEPKNRANLWKMWGRVGSGAWDELN